MRQIVTLFTILILFALGVSFWYFGVDKHILPTITQTSQTNTPPTQFPCAAVTVLTPKSGDKLTNPFSVNIIVDNTKTSCHWTVFEAQAGVAELRDSVGNVIGQAPLRTTDDWALQKPTPYNAIITLQQTPKPGNLTLLIQEENPSGKPNPQEITVTLSQ